MNFLQLIISITILIACSLSSCSDIVNTDMNKVGIKKDGNSINPALVEFRFDLDGLTFHSGDTTNLWSVAKPSTWAKTFNIKYLGNDSLKINDLDFLYLKVFTVYPLGSLPIILKPNEVKPRDVIMLELKTSNLTPGIYIDKVIINKDSNSGFFIRIKVN